MMWFLWELRNTMKYEHSTRKLDFLLHFGASSLVWFIYLPIVAIVASQVSPLWRYKLLLGELFTVKSVRITFPDTDKIKKHFMQVLQIRPIV